MKYWLKRDKLVTVHDRNKESPAIELFKVKQNLSNPMLCNIFQTPSLGYNLETKNEFLRSSASTNQYDLISVKCFASKMWKMSPLENKNSNTIQSFSEKIRKWELTHCNCNLCQRYTRNLVYVNFEWLAICRYVGN